ncbi:MAG: oligosaccharide flippase family protein, partial [Monoglobales bacterium]
MADKTLGQSVVKGSAILLIANLTVKIIGALFKIPLQHLIGDEGMGYFNAAYNIYAGLFVIATAGLPVAVSKMVSESMTKGSLKETKRIFHVAYAIFLSIGLAGSAALFLFADEWAATTKFANS